MQMFYFILNGDQNSIADEDGEEFVDEAAALAHVIAVVHELKRNREAETRTWGIQVCNEYLRPIFEVLFADVDEARRSYCVGVSTSQFARRGRTSRDLNPML